MKKMKRMRGLEKRGEGERKREWRGERGRREKREKREKRGGERGGGRKGGKGKGGASFRFPLTQIEM
ncbi:Crp/Fnr family transcriptional regulator, partial [Rhizobium johnstonii]